MAKERIAFSTKYKDLHKQWNLPRNKVNKIICVKEQQLVNEILDNREFDISNFYRDNRDDHEYVYDILEGRLMEEILVLFFEEKGFTVSKAGSDSDDVIHRSKGEKITTKPDLNVNGINIEVQFSTMGRRDFYHIKKGKGNRVLKGQNIVMFVVDNTYIIITKDNLAGCPVKPNGAWFMKECYWFEAKDSDYRSTKDTINWL